MCAWLYSSAFCRSSKYAADDFAFSVYEGVRWCGDTGGDGGGDLRSTSDPARVAPDGKLNPAPVPCGRNPLLCADNPAADRGPYCTYWGCKPPAYYTTAVRPLRPAIASPPPAPYLYMRPFSGSSESASPESPGPCDMARRGAAGPDSAVNVPPAPPARPAAPSIPSITYCDTPRLDVGPPIAGRNTPRSI